MNSLFSISPASVVPTPSDPNTGGPKPASTGRGSIGGTAEGVSDYVVRKLLRHSPKSGVTMGGRGGGGSSHHGNGSGGSGGSGGSAGGGGGGAAVSLNAMDSILEKETTYNKTESWNRLDKTVKLQKLNAYAEKYGRDHALPTKDVLTLRAFFQDALEKNKLQRTKDVIYDKEAHEIKSVPALYYNTTSRHFTLRITDTKRVSTLKSLTPLRRTSMETVFTDTILAASSVKSCDTIETTGTETGTGIGIGIGIESKELS